MWTVTCSFFNYRDLRNPKHRSAMETLLNPDSSGGGGLKPNRGTTNKCAKDSLHDRGEILSGELFVTLLRNTRRTASPRSSRKLRD